MHTSCSAQDLFMRFETRLNSTYQKPHSQTKTIKQKKKKNVGKVINEITAYDVLLTEDSAAFLFDTIARKRLNEKNNFAITDSSNSISTNSIQQNKKNKKPHNYFSKTDSTNIDSLSNQELIDEENTITNSDSIPSPEQIVLMDSAYVFLTENNFANAILYYNKVIAEFKETPEYRMAFLWRAKAEAGTGNFTDALIDFNSFISIDSCNSSFCTEAYYQRGLINFKLQHYQEAIPDFSTALTDSAYANYKYCYFYRAFCLGEMNHYIQAVQDYTKFLNLDKYKSVSSAEALYYRGFYKVKLDDNRGAISDYDLAIEMYSGAFESSKGKNQVYFQKLIDTYITRGLAYAEIKKWDEAISNYNTVIKMKPDYATAFHLKGLAEIGKGDLDAGCLDLSRAGELGSIDAYNDIKLHCK